MIIIFVYQETRCRTVRTYNTKMETTTSTTTTTTTVRSRTTIGFNIGFLTTPIGILMIVEIVLTLLAWTVLVSINGYGFVAQLGFAAFGFIFSWMITLGLFIFFMFGLHGTMCANAPWGSLQVIFNIVFAVLCFIASCCVAGLAAYNGKLQASSAFGFIVTVVYIVSVLLCFRKAYGRFPWERSTGQPANT